MFSKITKMLLVVGLLLSLVLTGCGQSTTGGGQSKTGEKVTIVFWDENAGPDRTPYYQELIKKFEEKYPAIHVEHDGLPKSGAKQKMDAAIAANDMPDVSGIQTSWLADFSARGALLPLDSFYEKWADKDKINPGIIQSNRNMTLDKKLYQIPNTMNLECLWYRADWYNEASVKAPETWDEFFVAVEKMTDKDKNRYGFSIRGGNGGSFQLQRMMYAYSGLNYFDANEKTTINDPKHVEFLKKYLGLYKTYTPISDVTNGYKEMVAGFDTGAVALVQHNIGSYSEHSKALKPGQYAPLILPKTADGRFIQESGNTLGYGIYKTTKNPEAAWTFVSFLCSQESQSYWNQKIGQIPTHLDSLKEPWAKELPHMQMALKVLSDSNLKFYDPPMYLPDYRSILDQVVDPGIQGVMTGKKTVEEFLNDWANAINKSRDKYDKMVAGKK
jgi:multiple sugar transport system substrate-binding protein